MRSEKASELPNAQQLPQPPWSSTVTIVEQLNPAPPFSPFQWTRASNAVGGGLVLFARWGRGAQEITPPCVSPGSYRLVTPSIRCASTNVMPAKRGESSACQRCCGSALTCATVSASSSGRAAAAAASPSAASIRSSLRGIGGAVLVPSWVHEPPR